MKQKESFDHMGQALLRFMEKQEQLDKRNDRGEPINVPGTTIFNEDNVRYFFERWRSNVKQDLLEMDDPEAIAITQAEAIARVKDEVGHVDDLEKQFSRWVQIDNPVAKLQDDLLGRGCTKATLKTYTHVAIRYMRAHNYEPTFHKDELMAYMASLRREGFSESSLSVARIALKCWFDVLGVSWPYHDRPIHKPRTRRSEKPIMFTKSQVTELINLVKERGTAEDKFYLCLATIWAPRRTELANITAENFEWNGEGGKLTFMPMKHGIEREHMIPAALVPYLKDQSAKAKSIPPAQMTNKFRSMCWRAGFKIPGSYSKEPRNKRKNYSWHAFRHSVVTALFEDGGFDQTRIRVWMGWADSSAGMPGHYYHPEDIDVKIMAKHPFQRLWA